MIALYLMKNFSLLMLEQVAAHRSTPMKKPNDAGLPVVWQS
jgi:hypothetical protein